MKNYFTPISVIFFSLSVLVFFGCSDNKPTTDPLIPSTGGDENPITTLNDSSYTGSNRYIWGYYDIIYDPETVTAEVIPMRTTSGHWNVLKWMEQGPCTNCVKIIDIQPTGNGTTEFTVELNHPFTPLILSLIHISEPTRPY